MTPTPEAVRAALALAEAHGVSNVANAAGDMRPYMECCESSSSAAARILAAALRQRDWQPIETAPRDGRQILVIDQAGQKACVEYRSLEDGVCCWEIMHDPDKGTIFAMKDRATHWHPLPDAPGENK